MVYILQEKLMIPDVDKLPSLDEVSQEEVDKLARRITRVMRDLSVYRADMDHEKKLKFDSIFVVFGNYSRYPLLDGVESNIIGLYPFEGPVNVSDTDIAISGNQQKFENFAKLLHAISYEEETDGACLVHLNGSVLGLGYWLETNPNLQTRDGRGLGSITMNHQASLDHVIMTFHISSGRDKLLRTYKRTAKRNPLRPYANIEETVFDPYVHLKKD
ncbi:MAG: hypothetical protein AABW46_02480 [Nanoarchaeota archaeon]